MIHYKSLSLTQKPINASFYLSDDVVRIAKQLLGKVLCAQSPTGEITAGIISETESYKGPYDRASHAYNMRRTPRNEAMYHPGGIAYIYLCYGMHHLFNVVTHLANSPHAVLVRALIPIYNVDLMKQRRLGHKNIAEGPGQLTQAMGISKDDNGVSLLKSRIWIEDHGFKIPSRDILKGPRIGIAYAKEHALLPWRFRISTNFIRAMNEI